MPDSGAQRQFFAVWPDPEVVAGVGEAIATLRADSPPWLRWQPPDRWHVTVLFLGDRSPDEQESATRTGARLAAGTSPTPLQVAGFGRFGSVLWAGIDGADWLAPVHRDLARTLQHRSQRERFRPHLTLARARRHHIDRTLLDRLGTHLGPPWTPRELTLVASVTGPQPHYEVVHRFPFHPVP